MGKLKVAQYERCTGEGGSIGVACSHAISLDKSRFDVVFVVKYRERDAYNDRLLEANGIRIRTVFDSPPPRNERFAAKLVRKLYEALAVPRALRRILKEEAADVVHIHSGPQFFSRIAGYLPEKVFFTCHTPPESYFNRKSLSGRINLRSCKRLVDRAGMKLIAPQEEIQKTLCGMFGAKNTALVYNGIDLNRFRDVPVSRDEIRASLGIPEDAFVLGNVGRFAREKNHEFLIDLFSEVLKHEKNAFLLLVGSGPLEGTVRNRLEALGAGDRSCILSNRSDIPVLMKAMDVFVLPSLFESFSLVLLEAQASGLRCVVSDRLPETVIRTKLVKSLKLEAPVEEWSEAVLCKPRERGSPVDGELNVFDVRERVKELERLYLA